MPGSVCLPVHPKSESVFCINKIRYVRVYLNLGIKIIDLLFNYLPLASSAWRSCEHKGETLAPSSVRP
jgi:hypothetical protein